MGHDPNIKNIQKKLLAWYKKSARSLPWRLTHDPYKVWVSEAMLQQTQVKTVIPYYFAFLKRFPTLMSLASAPLQDVLKMWEGLGYYSRARNLQRGAQHVFVHYLGRLPNVREELEKIPGIGPYMASAIASFAFGERAPLLDANGKRIVMRIYGNVGPENELTALAERLLPLKFTSTFNQAIMELGQTYCLPKNPHCLACPVHSECVAFQDGTQNDLPPPKPKTLRPTKKHFALLTRKDGKLLVERRKEDGLLGGLWQLPLTSMRPVRGRYLGKVEHTYTHFHEVIDIFEVPKTSDGYSENSPMTKWVRPKDLSRYPFTGVTHKAFRKLEIMPREEFAPRSEKR